MGAGEPDFDTPAHIKQAAVDALMKGETKYTPASGIPALKKAIAEKFLNDNGIKVEPSQVIVSPGAKFSGFAAICTLCGPGDEVIVPAPYWVSYTEMINGRRRQPRSSSNAGRKTITSLSRNSFRRRSPPARNC